MLKNSPLLIANQNLELSNGIFIDPTSALYASPAGRASINGAKISSAKVSNAKVSSLIVSKVEALFSQLSSKALFSTGIEQAVNADPDLEILSYRSSQFVEALDLSQINTVLELTQDCGGIAHFVADKVGSLDSVKTDSGLAKLSAIRCAGKPNVTHFCEQLDKLSFPEAHYDLVVIGKLEDLALPVTEFGALLSRLRRSLSANGKILINAKNSQRLSKEINAGADEIPFIESYQATSGGETLVDVDRRTLRNRVLEHDFSSVNFYASFSQHDYCDQLFSEDYLTSNVFALNHFHQLGYFDNPKICEYLYFKRLVEDKCDLVDSASRFVVIAGVSLNAASDLYNNDFTYFADPARKPENRALTQRGRSATEVHKLARKPQGQASSKSSLKADIKTKSNEGLLRQNMTSSPFHKGPLLIDSWLNAILNDDELSIQQRGIDHFISAYYNWLQSYFDETQGGQTDRQPFYELLPHSVIIHARTEEYLPINQEWTSSAISAEFILFRALFWFAKSNQRLMTPYFAKHALHCIGDFVVKHHPEFSRVDQLREFADLEQQLRAEIFDSSTKDVLASEANTRANGQACDIYTNLIRSNSASANAEAPLFLSIAWANNTAASRQSTVLETPSSQLAETQLTKVAQWQRDSASQTLTLETRRDENAGTVLRVTPLDQVGACRINSIRLIDANGLEIWSGTAADAAQNVQLPLQGNLLISSGSTTTLDFDLSNVDKLGSADQLCVTLSWVWGEEYSEAVRSLSETVVAGHKELAIQGQRLQAYQAKVDARELRISDLQKHRDDLISMVKKIEKRVDIERNVQGNLYAQIEHLEGRLHAQHIRNDELHSFLLMRPSSRIKRFASRWLNRLKGTPLVEQEPMPVVEDIEPKLEVPFEQLPEGEMVAMNTEDYELWIKENTLSQDDIDQAKAEIASMPYKPVFSILVPIYNTDPEYLLPMIKSVQNQIYPHWQLCLVDDSSPKTYLKRILEQEAIEDDRICIQLNDVNQGISVTTNDALKIATGDYIALLDHDDEITIDALYENAKLINRSPEVGLIYSDEDKMELDGTRIEPYFKPDYSPDLLDTNNYICHFTVIKRDIIQQIGGFREGLDGSQDHDVILRAIDAAEQIAHIPRILYHWRKIPGSTAVEYDSKGYAWEAGRKAIEDLHRKHEDGVRVEFGSLKGSYRIIREVIGQPLVSIVIPFKDKPALLDACINSILTRTSYSNFEIVGVSNNSEESLTHERMAHFSDIDERVRFVEHNVPFNFSEICNFGVSQSKGEYIVLLNNDVEIITPDWIENMLQHAQRDNVGAVGCKLLFPDGRIQHAGVVAGMVGAAGHPHKLFPESHIGYHGRLHMVSNVSAVTGAMMMMSKQKFDEVGGLDADNLAVAYNDVDLCLKLLGKGYFNVFTPYAKAIHHESVSRGYEDTDEKMQRLLKEQKHFLEQWKDFLAKGDPFYNPNMSLKNERFSLNFKD